MIAPKTAKPTPRDEARAYEMATQRDGNRCIRCGASSWVERDHRKNRSQGGETTVQNLSLLCHECHLWKTDHPTDALANGLAVPGWADPAEYPGRRWFLTDNGVRVVAWCLYRADGTVESISDQEAAVRRREVG